MAYMIIYEIKRNKMLKLFNVIIIYRHQKNHHILLLLFLVLLPCVFACQNPSDTKLEEVTFSNMVTNMKEGDTLVIDYLKQEM